MGFTVWVTGPGAMHGIVQVTIARMGVKLSMVVYIKSITIDNRGGGGIGNACVKVMMMSRRKLVTARPLLARAGEIHGAVSLRSIR